LDAAAGLGLVGLGRVDDGDVLGTTALTVDYGGTRLAAGAPVLAGRAIGHVVVELKIAVELGLDVDGSQGELVDRGPAAEGWGLLLLRVACATDDLLEGAGSKPASVATITLALPAAEGEVPVVEEVAEVQVVPAEAGLLQIGTLVVRVGWAGKRRSPDELYDGRVSHLDQRCTRGRDRGGTYCCRRAGGQGQERNERLHVEEVLLVGLMWNKKR
jgi:hypothetical protein